MRKQINKIFNNNLLINFPARRYPCTEEKKRNNKNNEDGKEEIQQRIEAMILKRFRKSTYNELIHFDIHRGEKKKR